MQTHVGSSQQHTSIASKLLFGNKTAYETVPTVQSVHHYHGQNTTKILVYFELNNT